MVAIFVAVLVIGATVLWTAPVTVLVMGAIVVVAVLVMGAIVLSRSW